MLHHQTAQNSSVQPRWAWQTWRGPAQLCCGAGERQWCVLGGARCLVPYFSCMSPNSQLHTSVPLQHQAILSKLSLASWEMLGLPGEGMREPCLEEPGMGSPPGCHGVLLKRRAPFSPGWCLPTSTVAPGAQGGQHHQVVSHMGERCQFCSPLSSIEILKQTVTKQVNLPLAWQSCPWQPGSWEESTEDMSSMCNPQVKQSQTGLLDLFRERSLSFQA